MKNWYYSKIFCLNSNGNQEIITVAWWITEIEAMQIAESRGLLYQNYSLEAEALDD